MNLTPEEIEELKRKNPAQKQTPKLIPYTPIDGEVWKTIRGTFPADIYQVSTLGRVRKTMLTKAGKYIDGIMKCNITNGRYFIDLFVAPNTRRKFYLHKMVLQTFKPQRSPDKRYVRWINGNIQDNRLENLEWSNKINTSKSFYENGKRAPRIKTREFVSKRSGKVMTKKVAFSDKDFESIRELYDDGNGISQPQLAVLFKCTQGFISQVINN